MFSGIFKYLEDKERAWRHAFGENLSTPKDRRRTRWHFNWVDHDILRRYWTNFDQVADGVFRSNQPSPERLLAYKQKGIKSVLNLRGVSRFSHFLLEHEACEDLGLTLVSVGMSATQLPDLKTILRLEQMFRELEKPFVMHCKSGADRVGFASALYLLLIENAPIEVASRELSFRYLHIKASKKGILDYCLEKYRKTNDASPILFRDWLMTVYDPMTLAKEFTASRRRGGGR